MLQPPTRGPTQDECSSFWKRLLYVLEQRDVTQQWTEGAAGKSAGYLSKVKTGERGSAPSYETVATLSRALHVNIYWLGDGTMPKGGWRAIFLELDVVDDAQASAIANKVVEKIREDQGAPASRPRHLHPVGGRKRPTK